MEEELKKACISVSKCGAPTPSNLLWAPIPTLGEQQVRVPISPFHSPSLSVL